MSNTLKVSRSLIDEVEKANPYIKLPIRLSFNGEDENNIGSSQLSVLFDAIEHYQEYLEHKIKEHQQADVGGSFGLEEQLIELTEIRDSLLYEVYKKIGNYSDLLFRLKSKIENDND